MLKLGNGKSITSVGMGGKMLALAGDFSSMAQMEAKEPQGQRSPSLRETSSASD
jgi:hypothetical protein